MTALKRISPCGRCNGTGWHTHGVCFGCNGLGVPISNDYLPYKKNMDAAVSELGRAEIIIRVMLDVMTLEQKAALAAQLEASGVTSDDMTRARERREVLRFFGK